MLLKGFAGLGHELLADVPELGVQHSHGLLMLELLVATELTQGVNVEVDVAPDKVNDVLLGRSHGLVLLLHCLVLLVWVFGLFGLFVLVNNLNMGRFQDFSRLLYNFFR